MSGDEVGRQASIASCAVLDTPREPPFDNIVFTAAQLFRAPIAMLLLIDRDRLWAKASVGPLARQWQRHEAFCRTVIETEQMLVIEDTQADPSFAVPDLGCKGEPIRFCASAPLHGPVRYVIGALSVLAYHPRTTPDRLRAQFRQLASEASELLCQRVPDLDLNAGYPPVANPG